MEDFDKTFENVVTPKKSEESLKEFSNWILGISVAVCAFLITESKELAELNCSSHKSLFVITLILAMLNAFISGFNKYLILKRDSVLSGRQDILKKILSQLKLEKIELQEAEKEWDINMAGWTKAFKIIPFILKVLNVSLILTVVTILLAGLYIILTI